MKEITYVTGNWAKIASAKQVLEPFGFTYLLKFEYVPIFSFIFILTN